MRRTRITQTLAMAALAGALLAPGLAGCRPLDAGSPEAVMAPAAGGTATAAAPGLLQPATVAPAPTLALPDRTGLTAEQVAESFYAWYISAVEASFQGGPLVYDAASLSAGGYLVPELVSRILAERDAMSGAPGGADPLLCAQDVPNTVRAAVQTEVSNRAEVFMTSDLVGHRWMVSMDRLDGAWRIVDISCGRGDAVADAPLPLDTPDPRYTPQATGPDTAPSGGKGNTAPADLGLVPAREGWSLYHNDQYAFHFSYPADWAIQEHTSQPDQPPLGPDALEMIVLIMPQAWADAMARQGPPDPNAPVIAPYTLEILRGGAEVLSNYPPATIVEDAALGGELATRRVEMITDALSQTRVVVQHPEDPALWLVFTDSISGFPDRLAGNEAVAAAYAEILDTVRLY